MPQTTLVEINLNAPQTPEERQAHIAGNVQLGRGAQMVPYMDDEQPTEVDEIVEQREMKPSNWPARPVDDGKPKVRFYNVGPSTYQIRCPLCHQRADTETVTMMGSLGYVSCLLSTLSCCFPIFALSFVYYCLQCSLKSKRLFCNKCGGNLGFYWRPQ